MSTQVNGPRCARRPWGLFRRASVPGGAQTDVYQQVEIERGPFQRVIELGADVRAQEAKAVYEDGMLRVELPLARGLVELRTVHITKLEDG